VVNGVDHGRPLKNGTKLRGSEILRWIWVSPGDQRRPLPWPVVALNWVLAFLFASWLCFYSFSKLRYNWNWDTVGGYSNFFWRGWLNTLKISAIALISSTLIGFAAAMARRSGFHVLRALSRMYVELIRGTPLLVQISFAFYVVADAFHIQNRFTVGIITLSVFSGAYISEIIRGGIESVGASQLESARAIGFTRWQTYRYVILPQATRVILPALTGMFANLIKDSSLLSVISIEDFTWNAQQVAALTYSNFECYIPLAIGYLVLTLPVTFGTHWLESRLKYET
jgi:polar amino acid transport system permease protein